jgi:hypothetical protein
MTGKSRDPMMARVLCKKITVTIRENIENDHHIWRSSSYYGQEDGPMNGLFRPHDFIRLVVSLMVIQVFFFFFFFRQVDSEAIVFDI